MKPSSQSEPSSRSPDRRGATALSFGQRPAQRAAHRAAGDERPARRAMLPRSGRSVRRSRPCRRVAEIGEIGRQVEPAIVRHQVLDAVEIAAEREVVDALLAAAALPVQVDRDDARALRLADGDDSGCADIGLQHQILLHLAHAGGDVFRP